MKNFVYNTFIEHPKSVDETYFEHLRFASGFAFGLFVAGMAAVIHAIIPCLCEKTASNKITELYGKIINRNNT